MKLKNIFTAIMLLFLTSGVILCCSKTEEPKEIICIYGVENSIIKELSWLNELVEQYKERPSATAIYQCTFNNGTSGFVIDPCVANCYVSPRYLYNWKGVELEFFPFGMSIDDYETKWDVRDMTLIWFKY